MLKIVEKQLKHFFIKVGALVGIFASIMIFASVPTFSNEDAILYSLTKEVNKGGLNNGFVIVMTDEVINDLSLDRLNEIDDFNQKNYLKSNLIAVNQGEFFDSNETPISLVGSSKISGDDFRSTTWLEISGGKGFKDFDVNSAIISQNYADELISSFGWKLGDYDRIMREYSLVLVNATGDELAFSIYGIYDGSSNLGSNFLNSLYGDFGDTVVIHNDLFFQLGKYKFFSVFKDAYYKNEINLKKQRELLGENRKYFIKTDYHNYNRSLPENLKQIDSRNKQNFYSEPAILITFILSIVFLIGFLSLYISSYLKSIITKDDDKKLYNIFNTLNIISVILVSFFVLFVLRDFDFYTRSNISIPIVNSGSLVIFVCFVAVICFMAYILQYGEEKRLAVKKAGNNSLSLHEFTTIPLFNDSFQTSVLINQENNESESVVKKNAVFISPFLVFPDVGAGAVRCENFIKLLSRMGYRSFAVGKSPNKDDINRQINSSYILFPFEITKGKNIFQKIKANFLEKQNIEKALINIINQYGKIDLIFLYSSMNISTFKFIDKFCQKNNIKLVIDIVEAQVISQQSLASFFTYYIGNNWIYKFANKKMNCGIITISRFLYDHFNINNSKNNPLIYIPFISDTNSCSFVPNNKIFKNTKKIIFLYAGTASGGRDLLVEMIKGFNLLDENEKERVLFINAGNSVDSILDMGLTLEEYNKSINHTIYLGRVSSQLIKELYKSVDYTVLLKPEKSRFSKAGFPAKVSESWAHGVPTISNITSDLHGYLIDGFNGYVVDESTAESFSKAIKKAINNNSYNVLRTNSRQTSFEKLNIGNFENDFRKFIDGL